MKHVIKFFTVALIVSFSGISVEDVKGVQSFINSDRPNVLFIMTDDQASHTISAYGGRFADIAPTPNHDRLADEGMRFNNVFVNNSICTPSRAAILTGTYSHINGVYTFTALDQSQPTLPKLMKEAGYQTAIIGKYHLRSNPVGFDYYSVLPGQGFFNNPVFLKQGDEHPSGWVNRGQFTQYEGHSTDVITDQTLDFLKNKRDTDKPFMLFAQYKAPHDPWTYAERYADYLEDVEIPEPDNLFDDYEGRSDALRGTHQYIGSSWGRGTHTDFIEQTQHLGVTDRKKMQYQLYLKKYLRTVKGIDDNLGRILDYLDESGLADNTIVIFTSDQGMFLGEHGLYDKRFMYEEALRMPLLIRWPGMIEQESVSDGMVLNVDFAPTILDAVGLQPHPVMQGRSFLPLLTGNQPSDWRESMYYRYYYSHFFTEPHYGVRTYDHKLIYFDRIDQWELYDLNKDPHEMKNVYGDTEYQRIVDRLKGELNRLQKELGDSPEDIGNNPNLGKLAPQPLHVAEHVKFGWGNKSVLVRFRTDDGGTLFSLSNLADNPFDVDYKWEGNKTLFIHNSNLMFNDSGNSVILEENINDNQWHTVAMVLHRQQPHFYIDGELKLQSDQNLSRDKMDQVFNIGAGLQGYNFIGDISQVIVYDEVLDDQAVRAYATGDIPEGKIIMEWEN